ncbi:hypothetical protein M0802_002490 [Mischocyttarus mexicanus]|nr:hypothetical protein M0802_002490 [Mischocyttarus mexicanus]
MSRFYKAMKRLGSSTKAKVDCREENNPDGEDTVLLAENMQDLQNMLNKVITATREYGLILNVKKIKYMIVTKTKAPN